MKQKIAIIGILIFLIGCQNNKIDDWTGTYVGLLPCKLKVEQKDTLYALDFNGMLMIIQNKDMKPIYDNFEILDLYLVKIKLKKDSTSNEIIGSIKFDIENYLNVYADTSDSSFYYVGEYVYNEPYIKNFTNHITNLDFDIDLFNYGERQKIVPAGILKSNDLTYFNIDTSFIGKLHTKSNPLFDFEESGKYFYRTVSSDEDIHDTKLLFYQNQKSILIDKLESGNLSSEEEYKIDNSIKYLNNLIELYE